jgi:hypothetical protein
MGGLDGGYDVEGAHADQVIRVNDVGVLDAEASPGLATGEILVGDGMRAKLLETGADGVDGVANGLVPRGLDDDLEAPAGPLCCQSYEAIGTGKLAA